MSAHTSWVEVNLAALEHNLGEIRRLVGPNVRIMAVVKADAYGHGAVETARFLAEKGADYLGVTTLEEGIELRRGGMHTPTLVFSPLTPDLMEPAIEAGLEQTVCDVEMVEAASRAAQRIGKPARVHLKVDTGLGRLGIPPAECPGFISIVNSLSGIEMTGIYTHFANAGARNPRDARRQFDRFAQLLDHLAARGIEVGLRHACNSAAVLNFPEAYLDMVRPGTILYGQYPTPFVPRKLDLEDTWTLKTRIVALRKRVVGEKIGYGSEFTVRTPIHTAVIPVGYADGFTLIPKSLAKSMPFPLSAAARLAGRKPGTPHVLIRGTAVPVVGRVSMQMASVDVSSIPDVKIGDEVIVPARRTSTSSRIPRIYLR